MLTRTIPDSHLIADHLNQLRDRAIGVLTYTRECGVGGYEPGLITHQILDEILRRRETLEREELIAAAAESRKVSLDIGRYDDESGWAVLPWNGYKLRPLAARALENIETYAREAVQDENDRRAREYETYRQAVLQGVAVPPTAK